MFINNAEAINSNRYYKCNKLIGKYLIKSGIPLLTYVGNEMAFSKTKKLQEALSSMPLYLRLLKKVGVING